MPLRKRCAPSVLSRDLVAESRFSRDSQNTNATESSSSELDPIPTPTGVFGLYRDPEGPEPQPPMTPPSSDGSLLSRASSSRTSHGPGLSRTPRTSSRRFERPNRLHIFLHVVACCASYPIIYAGTLSAKDKSLFWARVIVGLWCAGVGMVIGWSLITFARKYTEAASEHTFCAFSSTSWVPDSILISPW